MRRFCLTLVGLLAVLTAERALAQVTGDPPIYRVGEFETGSFGAAPAPLSTQFRAGPAPGEFGIERLPPPDPSAQPSPPLQVTTVIGEALVSDSPILDAPIALDRTLEAPAVVSLCDFMGYRYSSSSLDWMPGNGDQFGMFSLMWEHYQPAGINNGIGAGMQFHFPSGPIQTDMPPRLFNFSVSYQIRERVGPLAFDLASSVMVASDFNADARKGFLFPSHAVGYLTIGPTIDLVFGVDYLDRGDVKLLPVGGLIWVPNPNVRLEMVFPRPRAVFQLTEKHRFYVAGELGGGTWEIERANFEADMATYHDLRVCFGLECVEKSIRSAIEVAYLFDRRIEYTSRIGNMKLDDGVMLRLVTRY